MSEPSSAVKPVEEWWLKYIWLVTGIPFTVFCFLKLGPHVLTLLTKADPDLLVSLTLAFYLFCWAAGCPLDLKAQCKLYTHDPRRGVLIRSGSFVAIGLLFLIFFVICALQHFGRLTPDYLVWLFVCLWVVDHFGWLLFLCPQVNRASAVAEKEYTAGREYAKLEQLRITRNSIAGWWKWGRNICGLVVLGVLGACIQLPEMSVRLIELVGVPTFKTLAAWGILLYVCQMEGWIWHARLRRAHQCRAAIDFDRRYHLSPK
ncbi:MAG: hypothetical protein FJ304_17240 [Planctomycetes bacterium]|nr:hypothetical protein [Planctomycetota bacterium]